MSSPYRAPSSRTEDSLPPPRVPFLQRWALEGLAFGVVFGLMVGAALGRVVLCAPSTAVPESCRDEVIESSAFSNRMACEHADHVLESFGTPYKALCRCPRFAAAVDGGAP